MDRKLDSTASIKEELKNLANVESYKFIKDSLTNVLSNRIIEAKKQPKGLDFVTDNPQEWREPREVHSQPK